MTRALAAIVLSLLLAVPMPATARPARIAAGGATGRRYWNPLTGHSWKKTNGTPIQRRSNDSRQEAFLRRYTRPRTAMNSKSGPIESGTFVG